MRDFADRNGQAAGKIKEKNVALLIVELDKRIGNAKAWRDTLAEQLPDLEVRIWPDSGEPADIEYLAFMHPDFDVLPNFQT